MLKPALLFMPRADFKILLGLDDAMRWRARPFLYLPGIGETRYAAARQQNDSTAAMPPPGLLHTEPRLSPPASYAEAFACFCRDSASARALVAGTRLYRRLSACALVSPTEIAEMLLYYISLMMMMRPSYYRTIR